MDTKTIESSKDLKIGDFIKGRKIVAKMCTVKPTLIQEGKFFYQVPAPKRYPRRHAGSPTAIRVEMASGAIRSVTGKFVPAISARELPMVKFARFGSR